MRSRRKNRAFSLLEMLVVIAVIALLTALMVPSLARARALSRTTACAANLHTLGLAVNMYLDANDDVFFRYYTQIARPTGEYPVAGRLWWFGFEPGGPGTGMNRPLDKTKSPLAPYTANLDARMQCPEFPYHFGYFPKFNQHAASYGVNFTLAPPNGPAASRRKFAARSSQVFVFADGIHFDSNPGFNEGHYIQYTNPLTLSGYAHFRHLGRAQYVLLDGHVESQTLAGPSFRNVADGECGNLSGSNGPASIYGFP